MSPALNEGILLIDKPAGKTSFYLVSLLRKLLKIQKIGHAGTLDPLATGVMVMLVGKNYTRLSDQFLTHDKAYKAIIKLGESTNTYDSEGSVLTTSNECPTLEQVLKALSTFQGTILQTPPMFSAKKVQGQKLYHLARQGKEVERKAVQVTVNARLIDYHYPFIELEIDCSKGTYVRSIAHDLGQILGCGAHLSALTRTRSGPFMLNACLSVDDLKATPDKISSKFIKHENH